MSRSIKNIRATAYFPFVYGRFQLSNWSIPYFSTAISLRDAAESLRLASEAPGVESVQWQLDELYQRDVDWSRVDRGIVQYLRNTDVPQFFNALTIALLPSGSGGQSSFGGQGWTPPPIDQANIAKVLNVGPIAIGYWDDWTDHDDVEAATGVLRWNPDEVFAVALDGQHRLAALRSERLGDRNDPRYSASRVPVIFLMFDHRVGYNTPQTNGGNVDTMRRLFVDLNKHARTVSRARQILLDDQEPHAVCVRALVGAELRPGLEDLAGANPRIPLSLVDWHSEQAKFEDGPYIATVLGMDWIVTKLLNSTPISDVTDYKSIKRQLEALHKGLGTDLTSAEERCDELEVAQRPFTYKTEELEKIERDFSKCWNPAIIHIMRNFSPYSDLIELRESLDTFNLDFMNWYQHYQRSQQDTYQGHATELYRRLLGRLSNRDESPIGERTLLDALEEVNQLKGESLAFKVVFQRAMFLAFLMFLQIRDEHLEGLGEEYEDDYEDDEDLDSEIDDEEDEGEGGDIDDQEPHETDDRDVVSLLAAHRLERAEQFVSILNRVVEAVPDFLAVELDASDEEGTYFWQGTLRAAEGHIDFTQGASGRASDLIFLVVVMCLYDDLTDPDNPSDFDEFINAVESDGAPGLCKRASMAVARYSSKPLSAGGRILKARDEEFDLGASQQELFDRLRYVWDSVGL